MQSGDRDTDRIQVFALCGTMSAIGNCDLVAPGIDGRGPSGPARIRYSAGSATDDARTERGMIARGVNTTHAIAGLPNAPIPPDGG